MNVSKFYYINMDRSTDRKEHFLDQCKREKIPDVLIERFPALDGNVYQFSDTEIDLFKNCDFLKKNYKTKIMGNQLSHMYILKDIIHNEYPISVVFQDDSIF